MIALHHVSKVFEGKRKATALESIDLEIAQRGRLFRSSVLRVRGNPPFLTSSVAWTGQVPGEILIEGEQAEAKLSDDDLTRVGAIRSVSYSSFSTFFRL